MPIASAFRRLIGSTAIAASLAGVVQAQSNSQSPPVGVVSHLNVVSDKSQNISTLEAWKKTQIKEGMTDQEKAIAIFETLVRYRHQANPPREFLSGGEAGGHVHDPLKSFHVYGYGQCCCASAEVIGLARLLGMEARGRNINAHSVSEIFYDGSWHLVDGSVMNYFVKDDGTLASVDEINQAVRAWFAEDPSRQEMAGKDSELRKFAKNEGWKKGPPLLAKADKFYGKDGVNSAGWHGWPSTMQEYYKVMEPFEFCTTMGYQLNVQLRPGERITRNFFSRGIEYTNEMSKEYYKSLLDRKVLGIQTTLGDRAPGRVGDGTIEWNVPVKSIDQLKASALLAQDLSAGAAGVAPADPSKPGVLVLRFPSSYVYVKGKADLKATIAAGGSIVVSFSDNNGLDWQQVGKFEQTGEQSIDLSKLVLRRYDYRLKLELNGTGTTLASLQTASDFQLSQAALPTLTEGENQITFNAGPQEGTITIEGSTNIEVAQKSNQLTVANFHPTLNGIGENLRMKEGAADATFDVATPGEMKRIRVSAVWRARDAKDGFEVQVSYDGGQTFTPVEDGKLHGGVRGFSKLIVVDNIPAGTTAAKVRFVGKQVNTAAIFDLRIDADYTEPAGGFKPVKITYVWTEGGKEKTDVHVAKTPTDAYSIRCGKDAIVKSFVMELAE